jgi:hypothetical protein
MANYPSGFTPLEDVNKRAMGSLGEALGQSIQNIALNKAHQYQQGDLVGKLMSGYGIPREQAEVIASGGPKAQAAFLQQHSKNQANIESSKAFASGLNALARGEDVGKAIGGQALNSQHQTELAKSQYEDDRRKLEAVQKINEPYLKSLSEEAEKAERVESLGGDILKLIKNPKVKFASLLNNQLPEEFKSSEQQLLESYLNELVLLKGSEGKGVGNKLKLQLAQLSKANTRQTREAAEQNIIRTIEEAAKHKEDLQLATILNDKNRGRKPLQAQVGSIRKELNQLRNMQWESGKEPKNGDEAEIDGLPLIYENGWRFNYGNSL